MPNPGTAFPAFSRISAFARSSSCRMSVVVSLASCFSSSPIGRSCSSSGLEVTPVASRLRRQRRPLRAAAVGLVPACTRRLREPGCDEAEHGAAADDEPRLVSRHSLDVAQQPIAVAGREVLPQFVDALGYTLEHPRRLCLVIPAQLLCGLSQRAGGSGHLLAGLRRPAVDLPAQALTRPHFRLGRLL